MISEILDEDGALRAMITFDNNRYDSDRKKKLPCDRLEDFCTIKDISKVEGFSDFKNFKAKELLAQNKQKVLENEIKKLCIKYKVNNLVNFKISDELINILIKLENGMILKDEEVNWAAKRDYNYILATNYLNNYKNYNEPWDLIKACSLYRMSNNPNYVIQLTNDFKCNDKKAMAAVWTTRGGAFKDLGELNNAMECAKNAITNDKQSLHAYELAEAIQRLM